MLQTGGAGLGRGAERRPLARPGQSVTAKQGDGDLTHLEIAPHSVALKREGWPLWGKDFRGLT